MNFIIIICLEALCLTANFVALSKFEDKQHDGLVLMGIALTVVSIVTIAAFIVAIFTTRDTQKRKFNALKTQLRKRKGVDNSLKTYKDELKTALLITYPEYEKEIFKIMAGNSESALTLFFAQYPDLKYDKVLESYENKIIKFMDKKLRIDGQIYEEIEEIRNLDEDEWTIAHVTIPQWINDLEDKLSFDI